MKGFKNVKHSQEEFNFGIATSDTKREREYALADILYFKEVGDTKNEAIARERSKMLYGKLRTLRTQLEAKIEAWRAEAQS